MWKFAATWQAGHIDGSDTIKINSKNLHENGVQFPEERKAFVLHHQYGCHDITYKPAIHH